MEGAGANVGPLFCLGWLLLSHGAMSGVAVVVTRCNVWSLDAPF